MLNTIDPYDYLAAMMKREMLNRGCIWIRKKQICWAIYQQT